MTPEKQRIKIAEAHGWVLNPECDFLGKAFPQCWTHDDYNMVFHDYELPDYNDLNAMHDVMSIFDYDQADEFEDHLCDICKRSNYKKDNPVPWRFAVVNATASQRAEAFLRTLNLWES